jgi:hypothetical protein
MRKIWIALLMIAPCLFAQGGEKNCQEVSGAILTNFLLNETGTIAINNGTPAKFYATTLGTVTGDLRGAVGVYVLSPLLPGQPVQVHHHWVTEAGDTIFLADASAPTYAINGINDVSATVNYTVKILGGTGRFADATGYLVSFGAVDFSDPAHPRSILRYQGEICFAHPEH